MKKNRWAGGRDTIKQTLKTIMVVLVSLRVASHLSLGAFEAIIQWKTWMQPGPQSCWTAVDSGKREMFYINILYRVFFFKILYSFKNNIFTVSTQLIYKIRDTSVVPSRPQPKPTFANQAFVPAQTQQMTHTVFTQCAPLRDWWWGTCWLDDIRDSRWCHRLCWHSQNAIFCLFVLSTFTRWEIQITQTCVTVSEKSSRRG